VPGDYEYSEPRTGAFQVIFEKLNKSMKAPEDQDTLEKMDQVVGMSDRLQGGINRTVFFVCRLPDSARMSFC
jgi:hypothetical protein